MQTPCLFNKKDCENQRLKAWYSWDVVWLFT